MSFFEQIVGAEIQSEYELATASQLEEIKTRLIASRNLPPHPCQRDAKGIVIYNGLLAFKNEQWLKLQGFTVRSEVNNFEGYKETTIITYPVQSKRELLAERDIRMQEWESNQVEFKRSNKIW
jgi:hypothetical protein